jgi:hypothetical protein
MSVFNDPRGSFLHDVMLSDIDPDECALCREARGHGVEITPFDDLIYLSMLALEIL